MTVTGCPRLPASLKASAEQSAGAFSLWTSELCSVAVRVDSTYSSLSYLRTLPVDVIKLDRSFVTGISTSATTSAVAGSVVSLADALGLVVVAEGIESPTQRDELVRLGCGLGQGFLFSCPVAEAEIEAIVGAGREPVMVDALPIARSRAVASLQDPPSGARA